MKYEISGEVSVRKIGDEVFVFDRRNCVLHTFNDTGAFIWELMIEKTPLAAIPAMVAERFETDVGQASLDMTDFINELEKNRLVSLTASV